MAVTVRMAATEAATARTETPDNGERYKAKSVTNDINSP